MKFESKSICLWSYKDLARFGLGVRDKLGIYFRDKPMFLNVNVGYSNINVNVDNKQSSTCYCSWLLSSSLKLKFIRGPHFDEK